MNRTLASYSLQEVKRMLREEAKKLCERLAPVAVEVEVVDVLRSIRVFVKCIDVDNDRIDRLMKQKA